MKYDYKVNLGDKIATWVCSGVDSFTQDRNRFYQLSSRNEVNKQ
jgi:hypothetical protein